MLDPDCITPALLARFWPKVDKSGGPNACWPWIGCINPSDGYGRFNIDGIPEIAHRVAWMIEHGEAPTAHTCHRCDYRPCCNPAHLFQGSAAENMADCIDKGRTERCELHHAARLTNTQVREIRARLATGAEFQHEIAVAFGVTKSTISRINRGKSWRHLK